MLMENEQETFTGIAEQSATLSDRQQQVASLASDGLSNRMIAEKLGLSEGTVKGHLHGIYQKLGVRSKTQLMIVLANRGKWKPD